MTTEHTEEILEGHSDIEVNLPKEELFQLMMMAHERNITLNQLIDMVLREHIARLESEQDGV